MAVWVYNQPFDATVNLNEASVHNDQLPPLHDAVITLTLDNETKADTLVSMNDKGLFANIPHRFLEKQVKMSFTAPDFMPVDTTLTLTRDVALNIYRNPAVYGDVHFSLWNPETETFIPNTKVEVDGHPAVSDANGKVVLFIPLEAQRKTYKVKAPFPLYNDMLSMPCGENDVVEKM